MVLCLKIGIRSELNNGTLADLKMKTRMEKADGKLAREPQVSARRTTVLLESLELRTKK